MTFSLTDIISIISIITAIISVFMAGMAFHMAKKTHTTDLIAKLYSEYRSAEILRDLKIIWGIYHDLWKKENEGQQKKSQNSPQSVNEADKGILIPENRAVDYFEALDDGSKEYRAIHNMLNFWTYIQLLLRKNILRPEEIRAFTSPKILGFLCPIQAAHDHRYHQKTDEYASLEYSYTRLNSI